MYFFNQMKAYIELQWMKMRLWGHSWRRQSPKGTGTQRMDRDDCAGYPAFCRTAPIGERQTYAFATIQLARSNPPTIAGIPTHQGIDAGRSEWIRESTAWRGRKCRTTRLAPAYATDNRSSYPEALQYA